MGRSDLLELSPCPLALLLPCLLDRLLEPFLPVLDQCGLLGLGLRLELVLHRELLLEQLVVLLIRLLHVRRELFRMRSLQLIERVRVLLEVLQLPFEVVHSAFEPFLRIHNLQPHLLNLSLVVLFHSGLALLDLPLVLLELPLRLPALLNVAVLGLLESGLEVSALAGLVESLLLARDDRVGLAEYGLYLFLVGAGERGGEEPVFLVLRVQVEDDLGKLSDLLAHLVVHVLRGSRRHCLQLILNIFLYFQTAQAFLLLVLVEGPPR